MPDAIRAVLWDLDGTIADTEEAHYQSWLTVMAARGIRFSREEFLHGFGRSNTEILLDLLGPQLPLATAQAMGEEKERAFRQLLPGRLQLLPGVERWLRELQAAGIRQLVASSAPTANIVAMVQELGIGDYFFGLLSGAHLPKGKPDPAIFLQAGAAAGCSPATCLVVEDSSHGIEAARRAGMACIGVGERAVQACAPSTSGSEPARVALSTLEQLEWTTFAALTQRQ